MRSLNLVKSHVPAFLSKLWKLVSNPEFDYLISWNKNGRNFIIHDEITFSQKLLPVFFKHNNMASFVRQLNMYGFRKLGGLDISGTRYSRNEMGFYHPHFLRGQEGLLGFIKRKVPVNKSSGGTNNREECTKEVSSGLKNLQFKQECTERAINCLQQQNCMLWKQVQAVSEICIRQQRLLNQWIPSMVNAMSPVHQSALKGRAQLMISDGSVSPHYVEENSNSSFTDGVIPPDSFNAIVPVTHSQIKRRRQLMISSGSVSPSFNEESSNSSLASCMPSTPISISNRGPGNHDITETEASTMFADDIFCSSETSKENEVIVDNPLSCNLENSEQTMDSPFTDQEVLECFEGLDSSGINNLSSGLLTLLTPETSVQNAHIPILQQGVEPFCTLPAAVPNSPINTCSALVSPHGNPDSIHHQGAVKSMTSMNILSNYLTPDSSSNNLSGSMASADGLPRNEVGSTFEWFDGLNCELFKENGRVLATSRYTEG